MFAARGENLPNDPDNGVQNSSSGLRTIVAAGVPRGNIRVLFGASGNFGANSQGEVGAASERFWKTKGLLARVLRQAMRSAMVNYRNQFPQGANQLGIRGTTHDLHEAQARLDQLDHALSNATFDRNRIIAMRNFFNGVGSYKAGSLKLLMVQSLDAVVRNVTAGPGLLVPITSVNAQQRWTDLFNQIENGQI